MLRLQVLVNWSARVVVMSAGFLGGALELSAKEWSVPLAGNAFPTAPVDDDSQIGRSGELSLSSPADAFSIYFRVDRMAQLTLTLKGPANQDATGIAGRVGGTMLQPSVANGGIALGEISVPKAGYVKLEIWGAQGSQSSVKVNQLTVAAEDENLQLDFVRNTEGNMYYWGRRGPSVHLRYEVPTERPVRYAYSEINVPVGQDPIGSYYMANGFGEGYFGIQVNSAEERRVLFSVWSPFNTDNPRDIPKDQQIVAIGRGPDVHIGEFGNEGSGGQSYLRYPWQAGKTYRFLTEVKPDGKGQTVYTSWFGDQAADEWRLIASFRRPKTDTNLTGFHSFLESFAPTLGHIARRASYGNVWVRDVNQQWYECTQARFSVDATGGGRHRLDFNGGSAGNQFFLQNCGFFDEPGEPGKMFTRESSGKEPPTIDFDSLPRGT